MSWNFKKVGIVSQPEALKTAVNSEHAPAQVKMAICTAIDNLARQFGSAAGNDKRAIVVDTFGHVDPDGTLPSNSWNYDIKVKVDVAPLIDTPLPETAAA